MWMGRVGRDREEKRTGIDEASYIGCMERWA